MIPTLSSESDSNIRSSCKDRIEALEHWLRRLIDDLLTAAYGDYFTYADASGNRAIKKSLSELVDERRSKEPSRYPRKIDAVLLDDAINIVCNPRLYDLHFKAPFQHAFPNGLPETRTFLNRIAAPRNNLAHANSISLRQAEQIICYSNDVIDSFKNYYIERGMQSEYNVPTILKVVDSFGNTLTRSQFGEHPGGGILRSLADVPQFSLRPGDVLTIELEIDPAFPTDGYRLRWDVPGTGLPSQNSNRLVMPITVAHVAETLWISCTLTTTREWHRYGRHDDSIHISYRVLPPVQRDV